MLTGNVINNDGTKFFDDEFLIKTTEKNGETLKVGVFGVIRAVVYGVHRFDFSRYFFGIDCNLHIFRSGYKTFIKIIHA